MLIQQDGSGMWAKTKYSDIDPLHKGPTKRSDWALAWILSNGYAVMESYAINEVMNVIRALRELGGVEYTMKTIDGQQLQVANDKKWRSMYYEFTTVLFEDDRKFD
ncbi:hypothetical protein [Gracilibacillus sp. JCM 18860]|uniref:hypothetical protein n=1 Tax=Gracilibacillus sp. JCM 18860 TaxID=1306159 RepID=UPI0006D243B4